MAISPLATYTNVDNPGATYPYGRAKNESSPGALDGSPFEKAWLNDLWGFYQRILTKAGIAPSASPETAVYGGSQYLQAMAEMLLQKRITHVDDGGTPSTAGVYHLVGLGSTPEISQYPLELEVDFIVPTGTTNAGAATLSIDGLGDDPVVLPDGTALSGGEMVAGARCRVVRDDANTRWMLVKTGVTVGAIINVATTPVTLAARNAGFFHTLTAAAAAVVMPAIAGLQIGEGYWLTNNTASDVSFTRDGTSLFTGVSAIASATPTTSFVLGPNCSVFIWKESATTWNVTGLLANNSVSRKAKPASQVYTAAGASYTFAHNFGVIPDDCVLKLTVKAAQSDGGYAAGKVILMPIGNQNNNTTGLGITAEFTTTDIVLRVDSSGICAVNTSYAEFILSVASKWDMSLVIRG